MKNKLTKSELINSLETEQMYYDALRKDYEDRFTQMTSMEHVRRQTSLSASNTRLQNLMLDLEAIRVEDDDIQELVEKLIFDTNKTLSNAKRS